jgi:hypothetical protein
MSLSRPEPVYPINSPIAELRTAELFLVSSIRLWAAPHLDPAGSHADWRGAFVAAGIEEDGGADFDSLFRIVAGAARRSLDVRCARCRQLGEDEAWLLQLISALQQERRLEAAAILADWLQPAAVQLATRLALGVARAMAGVGLVVPRRHCEAASLHRLVETACVDRGLALVQ